eukprot:TRINITY_DN57699_c0_g1_i1.p1 TRINITY_DN57699_c0_g1~~TRINITY_DN57699_c0_g1_i1.p1  ORF type:complete len:419 (-),score=29.15 TRINITY_DN57699_c0_g1_i1:191-1447(-)
MDIRVQASSWRRKPQSDIDLHSTLAAEQSNTVVEAAVSGADVEPCESTAQDDSRLAVRRRRWQRKEHLPCASSVEGSARCSQPCEVVASPSRSVGVPAMISSAPWPCGRAQWLLDERCVELSLPGGQVRNRRLPIRVKPGSRAVGNLRTPGELFVLENGSSRVWRVSIGQDVIAEELTQGAGAFHFKSSLGSRMVFCSERVFGLLVTGTPGPGAHTPWLFNLRTKEWARLPDAPHPILSSAIVVRGDTVTIVGGWSKQRACHGYTQTLTLIEPYSWRVEQVLSMPWRRPGAGCIIAGQPLIASGWMECAGKVGSPDFCLLGRDGGAQRAATSSSRLCRLAAGERVISEVTTFPRADTFENTGEIYTMGNEVVCIGRDHIQAFDLLQSSWRTWPIPRELLDDSSGSWVKHCGSWALAWT